jgi:hypothetical protein
VTGGTVLPFAGEPVSVFPRGRVCAGPSCPTLATFGRPVILSIYNPNKTCWQCTAVIEADVERWAAERRGDFERDGFRLSSAVIERRMATIAELLDRGMSWQQIGFALERAPRSLAAFWCQHRRDEAAAA